MQVTKFVYSHKHCCGLLWLIMYFCITENWFNYTYIVLFRRRQPCKAPDQAAVTRPLMAPDIGTSHAPTDPVEMRRLNFQTPGMISHPPIPISELANHIERLKGNDNLKFSQEYEACNLIPASNYCRLSIIHFADQLQRFSSSAKAFWTFLFYCESLHLCSSTICFVCMWCLNTKFFVWLVVCLTWWAVISVKYNDLWVTQAFPIS